jgi:hypothetical protein
MFSDAVELHLTSVTMDVELNRDNELSPVAVVGLMLEPLTPELARELSDEIEGHCFDEDGEAREEMTNFRAKLREPQQKIVAMMAKDGTEPSVVLRNVRPTMISITKRGDDSVEEGTTKARKVSPGAATFRAVIHCLVVPDDPATREFLMRRFKKSFYFRFELENQQLPFGPPPKAKAEKKQKPLDFAAGARIKKITDEQVQDAIASGSGETMELTEPHIKKLNQKHRREILDWSEACAKVRAAKGDAIREDDLPVAPSFVMHPAELEVAPAPEPAAGDVLDDKKKRGAEDEGRTRTRRSTKKFTNSPRKVRAAVGKKKAAKAEVKH